ncbi:MAG TPA: phenylacetate--CoA ligase family protein, partial [Sumerlaeia bacterium]|nr:phenylacetate--CoA ligase family protein [Sumerlaeia bacterium]
MAAIGESTRDADLELLPAARRLEEMWNAPVHSTYASTEIATAFCECPERRGGHLRPELATLEILDDAGGPVPSGGVGEAVVTPLGVQGMPLVRFRTGDISFLIDDPCPCGRRTPRLGPILGRKNQMLKYKGTTLFPSSILAALEGRDEVTGAYVEARRGEGGTDRVIVKVNVSKAEITTDDIADMLRAHIRVAPEVVLVSEAELQERTAQPSKRKRATFFDFR